MNRAHMKINDVEGVSVLIEKITPLNNEYRDLIGKLASGVRIIGVMWDVGGYLEEYITSSGIKPHNLYWQIYGKAEGLKRSYITRDFLSYCLRIKRYFIYKKDISDKYSNLQAYSLFREAFPLLENSKYQLPVDEEAELVQLLNSRLDLREIRNKIRLIKKERIGITNTRKQKLNDMGLVSESFVKYYNDVYSLIKADNVDDIRKIRQVASKKYLNDLSQLISALTQEGLFVPDIEPSVELPDSWRDFISKLNNLFSSSVETRNRFRRLVAPRKIMRLSDMVVSLTDDNCLSEYKRKFILT